MSRRRTAALLVALSLAPGLTCSSQALSPDRAGAAKPAEAVPLAFDVASIREHAAGEQNSFWRTTPDGISMSNMHLTSLLGSAYKVKQDLISGAPAWADTKGFDIEAKVLPGNDGAPVKLTDAQQFLLLRALLTERFGVKAHIETKILPVYELVVVKSGPKLAPVPPTPTSPDDKPGETKDNGSLMINNNHLDAKSFRIPSFAENLGYIVQRTVIDKTGLGGAYNFTLDWTPENQTPNAEAAGTEAHPPIFTALQEQLGLKLVPSKAPVDTLVVDHAELPTAN